MRTWRPGVDTVTPERRAVQSGCPSELGYRSRLVAPRIELEPEEVAGLIRGSRLLELRPDTPPHVRKRWTDTALTAMDALCGLAERKGTDAVWDALELLSPRELLAFATLMASELAESDFALAPPE